MEKIVLSKGYEFEVLPNGVNARNDAVTFTFLPGEYTVEQLLSIWEDNNTILVKNDAVSIRKFDNYMKCSSITVDPNYLIATKYKCPECGTEVEPTTTTCPNCNAAFEAPDMEEIRGKVCKVVVSIPNINDRMSSAEESIDDIIDIILG